MYCFVKPAADAAIATKASRSPMPGFVIDMHPKEVFKAATVAWGKSKGRRDGAKRGAATRAHKRAAPTRERERVERLKQTAREVYAEQGEDPAVARRRSMRIPKKRSGSGMPSMMYSDSDSE